MKTTRQQPTRPRRRVRVRKAALDYPRHPCHPIPLAEATTATLVGAVAGDVEVVVVPVTDFQMVSVLAGKIKKIRCRGLQLLVRLDNFVLDKQVFR